MEEILTHGFAQMGIPVPQGAVEKLCRYSQLLLEQNQVMNLTAITDPEAVARLHFLDSAGVLAWGRAFPALAPSGATAEPQVAPGKGGAAERASLRACPEARGSELVLSGATAEPQVSLGKGGAAERASLRACPEARGSELAPTWLSGKALVDVGTGAGFPGVVLKILEPSLSLTLVDSLGKRVTWLEKVCEALSLDGVRCIHGRAEELALEPGFRDAFDVATSRAVAAFPLLCELCLPYVKPGGVFLAMKGVDSQAEVQGGLSAVKRLGGKVLEPFDYPVPGAGLSHRIVAVQKTGATPGGLPRSWGKIKKAPL